jgi:hypothetical protein
LGRFTFNWTGSISAYSINVYRCDGSTCLAPDGTANNNALWHRVAQHVVGLSYLDTAIAPSKVIITAVGGTGTVLINNGEVYAPIAQAGTISTGGQAQVYGTAQKGTSAACETNYGATTLVTGGTTTNTGLNCLPAKAIIDAVIYGITATITITASFMIGDANAANCFCTTKSKLAARTTGIWIGQSGSGAAIQTAASAVLVTTNANPGAGEIRLIVYYHTWIPPSN